MPEGRNRNSARSPGSSILNWWRKNREPKNTSHWDACVQYSFYCISLQTGYIISPSKLLQQVPVLHALAVRLRQIFIRVYAHLSPCTSITLYSDQSIHIRRISCSFMYFSRPSSRCFHHWNRSELQMSLNQGVNFRAGSSNMAFRPSAVTYRVSRTSLRLGSRSTSALMKRM